MNADLPNPLRSVHQQANAEMQPYADLEIVSTFNEPQAEYSAIHTGCGLMDLPQRGIIEVTGKDRHTFLNNLLTNELVSRETRKPMAAGEGAYAFLLNNKTGRITFDLNVLELGDRTIIEMDARLVLPFFELLDRYRFSEQVKWESRVGLLHEIALHGPEVMEIAARALDALPGLPRTHTCGSARVLGQDVAIWRDDVCGVPGLHLIVPTAHASAIWSDLVTRFGAVNDVQYSRKQIRPIGWAAFNSCRIEAGRPLFGIDFDDSVLPLELSLAPRGVSFTKGCYPGQEIVARMHARQQVSRQLVGLRMEEDALPVAGTIIYDDANNQIGGITSSTVSPILSNACIAMGYLKKPHFAIGAIVNVPAEGKMRKAKVVGMPFVQAPEV
jgi:folate-binding protein YgfZ